jgi:hypothetical protein
VADTQIRGLGTGSAPLSYTVPGSQEIVLKSLFASFDGSGAGGAFLPCVRIVAPGGGVVAEYIADSAVAAGSSAEVTFAPFLRGAASGSTATVTDFGDASYNAPLIALADSGNTLKTAGVVWVFDAAVSSGGYITKVAPANGSYFATLLRFHPQNAIYALAFTYASGPDYGNFDVNIASIEYQSASRPSGDPEGKLQDLTVGFGNAIVAGYGSNPVFKKLTTYNAYSAVAIAESGSSGVLTFIPGGAEGDVLTSLTAATDPYTLLSISDGGPGWYLIQFKVNGKDAASTNYRFRIISLQVLRTPDAADF